MAKSCFQNPALNSIAVCEHRTAILLIKGSVSVSIAVIG
jgi:hypothetical protein